MTNQAEPFPFINLSEPKEGRNEELRKLVRSTAMRSYRQKQKQKAVNPSTPQTSHIVHLPINDHILRDVRHITGALIAWNRSSSMNDLMSFYDRRSALEFTLTSLLIRKPKENMRQIDCVLEAYRIAALIYVEYVMYNAAAICPVIQKLKAQLFYLTLEANDKLVDNENRLQHGSVVWILIMGGITYLNNDEKEYFAQAIARSTRGWWNLPGAKTWEVMEACLKEIAWVRKLRTGECVSLWRRVEVLSNHNSDLFVADDLGCMP